MAETKTASLTVLGGPLAGTQCTLPENGTVMIGSSPGSTLQLDLPAVSPYHARVVVADGRITVHDTGSSRTVHVNDNALDRAGTELRNGDILWLGLPGDDDVVMLQCILPKRTATPGLTPPGALTPPGPPASGATPTPEIETVALWAMETAAEAASTPLGTPSADADEVSIDDLAALDAALPEPEPLSDAALPEPTTFPDEFGAETYSAETPLAAATESAGDDDAYVVDATEALADVAPTLLMSSPGEVADAVEPGYSETLAADAAAGFELPHEGFTALPSEPVYEPAVEFVSEARVEPASGAPAEPASGAPAEPAYEMPAETVVEGSFEPEPPPAAVPAPALAARPVEPRAPREARPSASSRPASRPLPPSASQRVRPATRPAPPEPDVELSSVEGPGEAAPSSRRPMLLAFGGFVGIVALAAGGWFGWRTLAGREAAPAATPAPVARASEPAPPPPTAAPEPEPLAATPEPLDAATPAPKATPTPQAATAPAPTATPTPRPTPTPRATPSPVSVASAPPPAPSGPAPEQARAQQVAGLVGQAEAALASRQYDAALSHLDGALRLEPGNTRATSLREDTAQRRDLARRRFVAGRTLVDSEKTRKEKERGGLVGFDTDTKAPDFQGRIEFEMSPASGIVGGDTWTLRVFVVNQGGKPIRVQGLTLGTTLNGAGSGGPIAASVREIAPQQRVQVAESTGTWRDGTTAWAADATLTAPRNETLKNTLTWK